MHEKGETLAFGDGRSGTGWRESVTEICDKNLRLGRIGEQLALAGYDVSRVPIVRCTWDRAGGRRREKSNDPADGREGGAV
jgi:hypothetical protein